MLDYLTFILKSKLRHARKLNEYFVNFACQHIEISLLLIDLIYFDFKIYRALITMFLINFENKVFSRQKYLFSLCTEQESNLRHTFHLLLFYLDE